MTAPTRKPKPINLRSMIDPINKVNKFVEENRGKKILCVGIDNFTEYLLENSSLKELDLVFLDDTRKKGITGKIVLYLDIFMMSNIKYDICIWTILHTNKKLHQRYECLDIKYIF